MSLLNALIRQTETQAGGTCAIVAVSGRATAGEGAWCRQLLEAQADQEPSRIVVDLSGVSSMDWWSALMLTWVARVVCRRRGWLVLASPRPEVAALLESAGTRAVVPVYDTVRQAVGGSRALAPAYARQHLGREELEGPF